MGMPDSADQAPLAAAARATPTTTAGDQPPAAASGASSPATAATAHGMGEHATNECL